MNALLVGVAAGCVVAFLAATIVLVRTFARVTRDQGEQLARLVEHTVTTVARSTAEAIASPYPEGDVRSPQGARDSAIVEAIENIRPYTTDVDDSDPTDSTLPQPTYLRQDVALLGSSAEPFGVAGLRPDPARHGQQTATHARQNGRS